MTRGSASITNGMWPSGWEETVKCVPDANPYIGHRMTIDVGMGKVACDCGEPFYGVVDLELHQQAFRHPGITSGWDEGGMT